MAEPLSHDTIVEIIDLVTTHARKVAREEIASMAGLVLTRTSDDEAVLTRLSERNIADDAVRHAFASIFGEVLKDFGGSETEPGT